MIRYMFLFVIAIVLVLSACDNETVIGQDLLGEEEIGTNTREDFEISAKTIDANELYTFVSGIDSRILYTGQVEDPVFGKYSNDIYLSLGYSVLPDFADSVIDSIVMVLQYDTLGRYGDTLTTQHLEVYRVNEDFATRDSIEADEEFGRDMMPLGSLSFVPNTTDSVVIDSRDSIGDFINLPPQIRVTLDPSFGAELLADSAAAMSDTLLLETLNGLYLTARTDGDDSFLPLRMDQAGFGSVNLYYTQGDTAKQLFVYPFRSETFAHFEKDPAGANIAEFIDDEVKGDSILFVQGQKGYDMEFSISGFDGLDSAIINRATLTLTLADVPGELDKGFFPDFDQLIVSEIAEDGHRFLIDDIVKTSDLATGLTILGGVPVEVELDNGETVIQYSFNITDYIDNVLDRDDEIANFAITPILRQESVRNTVFYGPGHSTYPAKLRITYTNLK